MVTHRIDSDFRTVERDTASPEDICATAWAWGSRMSGDTDADGVLIAPFAVFAVRAIVLTDAPSFPYVVVSLFSQASMHFSIFLLFLYRPFPP
jgi:hypothetical protein